MVNIFDLIESQLKTSISSSQKLFLIQFKCNLNLYENELTDDIIHEVIDKYIEMYKSNYDVVKTLQKFKQFDEIDDNELEVEVLRAINEMNATGPKDLSRLMHHLKTSIRGSADGRRVYQKSSYLLYNMNKQIK